MNTHSRFYQRKTAISHGMRARKLLSLYPIYASAALRGDTRAAETADRYATEARNLAMTAHRFWSLYRGETVPK